MKKKILSIVMAVAMMSTFAVGCGNSTTAENVSESVTEESAEAISEASTLQTESTGNTDVSAKPTTDRSGNEVTIPEEVNSIVSMAPSTTQILIDLGLGEKIVACDTYSYASYSDSLKADIPQFDMMTPDQEQIIALGADVVFTTGMSASHGDDVFAAVKEAGVCVLDIPSSASLQDISDDIRFIGAATSTSDAAEAIVSEMESAIEEISKIAATIPEEEKKTVLFELFTPSADSPTIYTCGSNTYINEMISLIGAINVAGEEAVILTADMYTDDVINVILSMSGWENVSAIKDKAVYQIDNDTVNRPNHHVVSAMIEMARDIYPDYYETIVDPFGAEDSKEQPAA